MTKNRYYALDAWRGIAALFIVLLHKSHIFVPELAEERFVKNTFLFVDFFFVLSGFVIAHTYQQRLLIGEVVLTNFVWRRFLRLWPLHIFTMFLIILYELDFELLKFIHQFFLLHAVVFSGNFIGWNDPSWSISAEFYTYLIFGVLFLSCKPNSVLLILASLAICIGIAVYSKTGDQLLGINTTGKFGLLRCIAGFAMGVLLFNTLSKVHSLLERVPANILEITVIAALILFITYLGQGRISVIAPFFFFWFVAVFSMQRGSISQIFGSYPFQLLGVLSYSIYMTHIFVMSILGELLPEGIFPLLAGVCGVIVFSYLTHRFIETPFYKR
jgi:peptidoglycan/LPS O-acetylase OafA/YrhL